MNSKRIIKGLSRPLAFFLAALVLAGSWAPAPPAAAQEPVTWDWAWTTVKMANEGETNPNYTIPRLDERPSVDGEGNAYFTPEDGYLYCLGPDGETRWRVFLNQAGLYYGIGGKRPVFDREGNIYLGSGDGNLYSLSPAGQVRWTFPMKDQVAVGTSPALSPDGETVYVVTMNLYLHAVDLEGRERWSCQLEGSVSCNTPTVAPDGTIYVGSLNTDGSIVNAVKADGSLKWSVTLRNYRLHVLLPSGLAAAWKGEQRMAVGQDGTLYLVATNWAKGYYMYYNTLLALDPASGEVRWRRDVDTYLSAPALSADGETLYYKTYDNRLYALDSAGGTVKWTYHASGETSYAINPGYYDNEPAVEADGTVLTALGQRIYAVQDKGDRGELLWQTEDMGGLLNMPSARGPGGEIYVFGGSNSGIHKFTDHTYAPQLASLALPEGHFALLPGGSYTLQPQMTDVYGRKVRQADLVWASSADGIAAVDQSGRVTAKKPGQAVISVSGSGAGEDTLTASVAVTVLPEAGGLSLQLAPSPAQVQTGQVLKLTATLLTPESLPVLGETLEWGSLAQLIAAVDQSGTVSGLKAGQAEIRARVQRYPDLSARVTVTVKAPEVKQVTPAEIQAALEKTLAWFRQQGAPGDWAAFGLNAAGEDITGAPYLDSSGRTYLAKLEEKLGAGGAGAVGSLMTDFERTAIGVVSAGGDPSNVAGVDLLDKIVRWGSMGQGINAAVFGLIALDAANAPDPVEDGLHTRKGFIDYILQNKAGDGWAFSGANADPDMTAMALYALAPYRQRPEVKAAGEKAIQWLSSVQAEDGRFGSWGAYNAESCAQVIMGITAWGIDPQGAEFTKTAGNAVTGLLSFQLSDGVFMHTTMRDTGMATDQSLEALAALKQYYVDGAGISSIFYRIQCAGTPGAGEITALDVYPAGLVLQAGQSIRLRAKNQKGLFVDDALLDWQVSDAGKACIVVEGEGGEAVVNALAAGAVNIAVSLKDNPAVRGTTLLTVAGREVAAARDSLATGSGTGKELAVELTNLSGAKRTALVIIAVYDKESGELVHQSYVSRELAAGETQVVGGFYPVPQAELGKYQVKALVWDKWLSARPLADAIVE